MAYDFQGSIAQQYIQFAATIVTTVTPGENYYKVMLFMGYTEASSSFTVAPAVGSITELTLGSFTSAVIGPLLAYLSQFYAGNFTTHVYVVIYDDSTVTTGAFPSGAVTALTTQFNAYKERAYFKLMTLHNNIPANSALATLCYADTLLSQCWIDANDAQMLVLNSTTSMYGVCHTAGSNPVIVFHQDAAKSGALTQLGLSLATINDTGTPVANSLDYLGTANSTGSGTAGANLSTTDVATLTAINCGFFLTIGDGTGKVALKGGKTIKGDVAAANWTTAYVDFVAAVQTANMLTTLNRFKNNETYQCILSILANLLHEFANIGRLSTVTITAPAFAQLPASVGDMITVPNAWTAYYNDNVRKAQVQGTLYISQS